MSDEAVRVVVRVRPPNQRELDNGFRSLLSVSNDDTTLVVNSKPDPKTFTFDHCFDIESTQEEIFHKVFGSHLYVGDTTIQALIFNRRMASRKCEQSVLFSFKNSRHFSSGWQADFRNLPHWL
jgi:hypothetical protein